jgi:hypothetical protein
LAFFGRLARRSLCHSAVDAAYSKPPLLLAALRRSTASFLIRPGPTIRSTQGPKLCSNSWSEETGQVKVTVGVPLVELGQTDSGFERWTRDTVSEIET